MSRYLHRGKLGEYRLFDIFLIVEGGSSSRCAYIKFLGRADNSGGGNAKKRFRLSSSSSFARIIVSIEHWPFNEEISDTNVWGPPDDRLVDGRADLCHRYLIVPANE